MKEFFIPIPEHKELEKIREGLRGFAEFVKQPSKPEQAQDDAVRNAEYFAYLNYKSLEEALKKLTTN